MPEETMEGARRHSPLYEALRPRSTGKLRNCMDEWVLVGQEKADWYGSKSCVCGHPILRMYIIQNLYSHDEVTVGACCINQVEAKNLRPRYRSKYEYLKTAQKLARTEDEKLAVEYAIRQFKKFGSNTKLGRGYAAVLQRITGHPWRWVWRKS